MKTRRLPRFACTPLFPLFFLSLALSACGDSQAPGVSARGQVACSAGQLCAGAAKRAVSPTQAHIDGVEETRLGALPHTQKFNLGGFGFNPTQNFPNPFSGLAEALTQPAQQRAYIGRDGHEEDIWVRVMVLEGADEAGAKQRIAFVALDAIGAGNIIQDKVAAVVGEASCALGACIAPADVLFGQTHTHASADLQGLWGGVPQDWIDAILLPAIRDSVTEALSGLQPAELTVAQTQLPEFNNYRRPRVDPNAVADETASLLQVAPLKGGRMIASLFQFAAHPTSINEDPRIPHPDYILGLTDTLEKDGGVALFYNGDIADASGSGGECEGLAEPDPYEQVRCRGEDLVSTARGRMTEPRKLAPTLSVRHATAVLPVTNPAFAAAGALGSFGRYYNFTPQQLGDIPVLGGVLDTAFTEVAQPVATATTYVSRITLGGAETGLEMVTIPGEATNTFGQYIRSLANPGAEVMLLGLTQNSLGYIIPEEEFSYVDPTGDDGFVAPFTGYEEFVSLGPLTAPMLRVQAYAPLFDVAVGAPSYLTACADPLSDQCLIASTALKIDYIQRAYAQQCLDAGAPADFCALLNPDTPLAAACRSAGLPESVCTAFGPTPPPP